MIYYTGECEKCGKLFEKEYDDKEFERLKRNGKLPRFCCRSHANSHKQSDDTKKKISQGVKNFNESIRNGWKHCKICGKEMIGISESSNKTICSDECKKMSRYIPTLIKYFGFDESKLGTEYVIEEVSRIRNILIIDYWENGLTSTEIGKKYGYPSPCNLPGKIFGYLNIPTKNCTTTNVESILKGRKQSSNLKYKCGWHTTFEGKEVYLRSSYEFDYAEELDKKKISYDVECLRIKYFSTKKNRYACAIPDFYLPETNTIVEIKSNFTIDEQEMRDKKKAYEEQGYKFKLILEHKEIEI